MHARRRSTIDLAETDSETLHALYVIETRIGYDSAIIDPETVEDDLRAEGEAVLEAVGNESRERDVALVDRIEKRGPERVIVEYVEREGIDIVVLGSRGKSAFKSVLLGSTSEVLVRDLPIPSYSSPTATTGNQSCDRFRTETGDTRSQSERSGRTASRYSYVFRISTTNWDDERIDRVQDETRDSVCIARGVRRRPPTT
ncbi:universal stress protein [Haloterrigena salifodinae]|uniref:universal stress protein n=1 Tax=Haloterrigena salifodinae TaxID=2675099 RepID=UPI002012E9F2|nr:universal stress protein [Haloterrigena salifodinae]